MKINISRNAQFAHVAKIITYSRKDLSLNYVVALAIVEKVAVLVKEAYFHFLCSSCYWIALLFCRLLHTSREFQSNQGTTRLWDRIFRFLFCVNFIVSYYNTFIPNGRCRFIFISLSNFHFLSYIQLFARINKINLAEKSLYNNIQFDHLTLCYKSLIKK